MLPPEEQDHEWLSAHLTFDGEFRGDIYRAPADRVICEVVGPIVRRCRNQGWIRRFFFVRYSEKGPHIRLRLFGRPQLLRKQVRPLLLEQSGKVLTAPDSKLALVRDVDWIPYEPETDRYGGPQGILLAERFFDVSSWTALDLLHKIPPGERPARLGKGLLSTLVLLHAFSDSRDWCAQLAESYGRNYLRAQVPDPQQQENWMKAFEEGYDRQADKLAAYVEAAWEALESGEGLTGELDVYRQRLRGIRRDFGALFEAGQLEREGVVLDDWRTAVGTIVASYMHMMSNRLGVTIREESYLSVLIHLTLAGGGSKGQSRKSKAQGPRSKVQGPRSKVQSPRSKGQGPKSKVQGQDGVP